MSASVKITLLQKPAFSAVHNCNYINATDAEYCSCSIYTAGIPILTKEGEGNAREAQANGGARGGQARRMHRCGTVRSEQFRTEPALSKEELKDSYIKIKVGFQTG